MTQEIREKVDIDAVLAKVQKMLNVEGRTPEEAASYIEKAHAILADYDLSIESVHNLKADKRTSIRESLAVQTTEGKPDGWKVDLLEEVARLFDVRVIFAYEYEETKSGRTRAVKNGQLVGFGHDVEAAGYAFSFVVHEITRMAKDYARVGWNAISLLATQKGISHHDAESWYVNVQGHHHPLKSELTFIKGATQTIRESLRSEVRKRNVERREEAETNPNALVVQKSAEVDDYLFRRNHNGMSKAEWDAKVAEEIANGTRKDYVAIWRAEDEAKAAREREKHAKETPEQHARCEAREAARAAKEEAKENARYWRQQEARARREARERLNTDHDALWAGQAAGRNIKVRRGIGGGNDTEAIG